MFVAYVIGVMLWAVTLTDLDSALSAAVLIIFTVLALVGYPVVFETATRGRSLGKMAMGLRVVSDDGGPERFRQALFRALAGFIEIWMFAGGPAVICSMVSAKGKRIGDVFAGTMVISERAPRLSPPPPMPPPLAWWASSLQLSGLRPEQAERARQFLSRATQLDPGSATRWPTGSPPRSSPRSRRRRRRARRRRWCWPRCSPSGTAGSWPGCRPGAPPPPLPARLPHRTAATASAAVRTAADRRTPSAAPPGGFTRPNEWDTDVPFWVICATLSDMMLHCRPTVARARGPAGRSSMPR